MCYKRFVPRAVFLSAAACLIGGPAGSQENAAEENFGITVSQSLRVTDNIRLNEESVGTTSSADTNVDFGYRFGSEAHSLTLRGGGVFRFQDDPVLGRETGLSDANINADYLREGVNARLQLQSRYVRTDLLFNDPLEADDISEEDLGENTGSRNVTNTSLNYETGLQSVLGLRLQLSQRDVRYSETIDPDRFDTETRNVTVTLPWRLSGRTNARLSYFNGRYDAEDAEGTERDTERLTIGLSHAFSPISRLSLDVGRSEVVETFDTLPGVEDVDDGTIYNVSWSRDLPNGALETSYSSNITQDGRRSTFEVERAFDLPDGDLTIMVGTSDGSESSLRPIGAIRWSKENDRSNFTAVLSRSSSVSTTSSEVTETTRLNLNYGLSLTEVSSLSLGFRYAEISELNGPVDEEDRRRTSFDVSLNRRVTDDWNLVTGYQYRHTRRDTGASGRSNALFFTLRRDFGGLN